MLDAWDIISMLCIAGGILNVIVWMCGDLINGRRLPNTTGENIHGPINYTLLIMFFVSSMIGSIS